MCTNVSPAPEASCESPKADSSFPRDSVDDVPEDTIGDPVDAEPDDCFRASSSSFFFGAASDEEEDDEHVHTSLASPCNPMTASSKDATTGEDVTASAGC